jgi:phospholipid/cholesterol/gamma-HCH transport system permease protein
MRSNAACPMHPAVDPRTETEAWRLDRTKGGVRLVGRLRTPDAPALVDAVREATAGIEEPTIDLSGVEQLDGGVVALLCADLAARGGTRSRLRVGDRFWALLDLYGSAAPPLACTKRRPEGVVAHVGRASVEQAAHFTAILAFTGEMAVATRRIVKSPRRGHWKEIPHLVERAGADAMPIVLVINFLIGFVLAYMAARALQTFGANVYVADLVGIGMTRQLGPLMTAVIVCGRSGAAYTTELGSMKVDEEIDALRTLGLEPYGWLVMPRLLALVLVVPVLTVLADVAGVLGGLVVAVTSLGLPARGYFNEMRSTLAAWDVQSGLVLSVAFAIAIGLIACEQGFAASGGPQGVGRRTTSTVVTSLFAIVLLDAGITVLYRSYGLS